MSNIHTKLRPVSKLTPLYFLFSSSSISHKTLNSYISSSPISLFPKPLEFYVFGLAFQPRIVFRLFSTENCAFDQKKTISDRGFRSPRLNSERKQVIEAIKGKDTELGFKLNSLNANLSAGSICEIFDVLNRDKVSGLRFFGWIQNSHPNLRRNSDVCSSIISNCGCLDDYDSMLRLLNEFKSEGICLTEKAFGFLDISCSRSDVVGLVELLNKVGGSCCSSGVYGLIKMLAGLNLFDLAEFVIEITQRKTSYYNILIRAKCQNCDFEGAENVIDQIGHVGCHPDSTSCNYILSGLCKYGLSSQAYHLLEKMEQKGCPPDSITFEILVCYSCQLGNLEMAMTLVDRMECIGLEPRPATHAALIKAYLDSGQYEKAHDYVVRSCTKFKMSSNATYSLLVNLHRKSGRVVVAQNILIEMMEKGLQPDMTVYCLVLNCLKKSNRRDLADQLRNSFSRFLSTSSMMVSPLSSVVDNSDH
ncbi:Pentatricopeptide repeat [Dillenia turbinata]|uniref:Pentatricopeptide repeat n=1 Tax=Dillenia turbinata TaxID=194707 RepID=A0AAN8Z1C0_9MAGN